MWFCPSYHLVVASPLLLDVGYLSLVDSNILLLIVVQQLVVILVFSREKMSTRPSTLPSCSYHSAVVFCDWLLWLRLMFSRFHVVASISTKLLFIAKWYSFGWIHRVAFIHLSVDGRLGCFLFGTIMNICVDIWVMTIFKRKFKIFLWKVWTSTVQMPFEEKFATQFVESVITRQPDNLSAPSKSASLAKKPLT